MDPIRISAKVLGAMALDDFCERCFWIKLHTKKLPWQIFPGIFSSIDAYTKRVAHHWIDGVIKDSKGNLAPMPDFMAELGVTGWLKTPHWSKFNRLDDATNITLSGSADDIWTLAQGGIHIPDYKTAKYTKGQDRLIPMYEVQLNGYGWIADGLGHYGGVQGLSMIYMEPVTDDSAALAGACDGHFKMQFNPKFVPVEMDPGPLFGHLSMAREIYDGPMPAGRDGCKDCEALDAIIETI
jgi:hypothetical protein